MDQEKMGMKGEMEGMEEGMGWMGKGMNMGMMPGMAMHKMGMMGMGMGMKGMGGWRMFYTKEEKMAKLQEYLKDLQMEEKGVQEMLDKMSMMK